MKVLFLSQIVPYPPHGGVLQRGYHVLRELGSQVSIDLLAFVHPDVLRDEASIEESRRTLAQFCQRVQYFRLWAKQSTAHRVAALAASAFSRMPFSVVAHRSKSFQRAVWQSLQAGSFDLIHIDTLALAQFVGHGTTVPWVLTHHNVESMLMARRAEVETGAAARAYLRRDAVKLAAYEATASRMCAMNIMVSSNDEQALHATAPGVRTSVVPNGVDVQYFCPDSTDEVPALIYTGGMNMFANRDAVMFFLREIWPLIRAGHPDVRFFAVGQDPPAALKAFAANDSRIVVTGYVDDIRPLVRRSAIYVVPLRVGGGTRLKVLDAMAMGKAMVSTTIGCEGIEANPGEHLIIADTPEGFSAATLMLLNDREARRRLGTAARALVEQRYAWPVIRHRLVDAYREAIDLQRRGK